MRLANAVDEFNASQQATAHAATVAAAAPAAAVPDVQIPCQICPQESGSSVNAAGSISLGEMPEYVATCRSRVENWYEGLPMAACDHAVVAQGENNGGPVLNLLPNCGHVLCVECEQKARSGMVRRHGDNEYVYPCPQHHACGEYMPCPGGFEITLQQ